MFCNSNTIYPDGICLFGIICNVKKMWRFTVKTLRVVCSSVTKTKPCVRSDTEFPYLEFFCLLWRCDPTRVMTSSILMFLDHTQRRTTDGRTPLDEWSARRRDLYLTTHNTHNRQTSMPPEGFKPTISAGERPQTYALDRAATGTGSLPKIIKK